MADTYKLCALSGTHRGMEEDVWGPLIGRLLYFCAWLMGGVRFPVRGSIYLSRSASICRCFPSPFRRAAPGRGGRFVRAAVPRSDRVSSAPEPESVISTDAQLLLAVFRFRAPTSVRLSRPLRNWVLLEFVRWRSRSNSSPREISHGDRWRKRRVSIHSPVEENAPGPFTGRSFMRRCAPVGVFSARTRSVSPPICTSCVQRWARPYTRPLR